MSEQCADEERAVRVTENRPKTCCFIATPAGLGPGWHLRREAFPLSSSPFIWIVIKGENDIVDEIGAVPLCNPDGKIGTMVCFGGS